MDKIISEEGLISLGPWGGKGGVYSVYKAEGPIMQITICCGDVIDSILFESISSSGVVEGSSVKIGGTGGGAKKFRIDNSVEQLSSISLTYKDYYGQPIITSLCFETNIGNKYGPFGSGSNASSVSIPIEGGFIAGFYGRGGSFLDAIGIFVAPKAKINGEEGWISVGPWGGKGGVHSTYKAEGPIMQITVRHGDVIDSILFENKSCNDNVIGSSVKIGGTGGTGSSSSPKFCIDSSVEQLTSISLTYNDYYRHPVITSLCFETNIGNKYGPFGQGSDADASSVSIPIEGGFIAGFYGSVDHRGYLEAIGIFVAPKVTFYPLYCSSLIYPGNVGNEGGCISSGIGGGKKGAYWAYKPDGPIMLISVRYGKAIDSVIFQSKIGDKVGRSVKIGDGGGGTTKTFSIDSSVEQISSINLTYEEFHGEVTIISLGFETNVGNKYGPFGSRMGTSSVSIPIEGGDFAGFHGRVGTYLTAIGVLVAPKYPK